MVAGARVTKFRKMRNLRAAGGLGWIHRMGTAVVPIRLGRIVRNNLRGTDLAGIGGEFAVDVAGLGL